MEAVQALTPWEHGVAPVTGGVPRPGRGVIRMRVTKNRESVKKRLHDTCAGWPGQSGAAAKPGAVKSAARKLVRPVTPQLAAASRERSTSSASSSTPTAVLQRPVVRASACSCSCTTATGTQPGGYSSHRCRAAPLQ
jgi:hypothetical protein